MQGIETAQFRCSALAMWCPLDLTPPKTSPALHPRVCHGKRGFGHPWVHQPPRQSLTCLTGWEETCPTGNKHRVQQLVSRVSELPRWVQDPVVTSTHRVDFCPPLSCWLLFPQHSSVCRSTFPETGRCWDDNPQQERERFNSAKSQPNFFLAVLLKIS